MGVELIVFGHLVGDLACRAGQVRESMLEDIATQLLVYDGEAFTIDELDLARSQLAYSRNLERECRPFRFVL